ncbi:unnamed protein product [Symbiodinium sp. KB8]|nr:unnamed protein product [Symbiodinium sp. KB8]
MFETGDIDAELTAARVLFSRKLHYLISQHVKHSAKFIVRQNEDSNGFETWRRLFKKLSLPGARRSTSLLTQLLDFKVQPGNLINLGKHGGGQRSTMKANGKPTSSQYHGLTYHVAEAREPSFSEMTLPRHRLTAGRGSVGHAFQMHLARLRHLQSCVVNPVPEFWALVHAEAQWLTAVHDSLAWLGSSATALQPLATGMTRGQHGETFRSGDRELGSASCLKRKSALSEERLGRLRHRPIVDFCLSSFALPEASSPLRPQPSRDERNFCGPYNRTFAGEQRWSVRPALLLAESSWFEEDERPLAEVWDSLAHVGLDYAFRPAALGTDSGLVLSALDVSGIVFSIMSGQNLVTFSFPECLDTIPAGSTPTSFKGPFDDVAFEFCFETLQCFSQTPSLASSANTFHSQLATETFYGDLARFALRFGRLAYLLAFSGHPIWAHPLLRCQRCRH